MRIKLLVMIALTWFLSGAILLPASFRSYSRHSQHRKDAWEPAVEIQPGITIPGFWRPRSRRGYNWEKGYRDEDNRWYPGYWKPLNSYSREEGAMKWVPGYWTGENWNPGYWRRPERDALTWIDGYHDWKGRWRAGCWRPITPD